MKRIEIDVVDPRAEQTALTEKPMALLEHVVMRGGLSIRQLAGQLERDYRNVYDDVRRLIQLGLIEIQAGKLHVPYDEIDIHKTLRNAA